MKFFSLFSLALLCTKLFIVNSQINILQCGVFRKSKARYMYIVGGSTVNITEFPWHVIIFYYNQNKCGGSIINHRWIVTAAHCVYDRFVDGFIIRTGTDDIETVGERGQSGSNYSATKILYHPKFDKNIHQENDIALIKTSQDIKFSNSVNAICLPKIWSEPQRETFIVSGFGRLQQYGELARFLQKVTLDLFNIKKCAILYQKKYFIRPHYLKLYQSQICAWDVDKDACQIDSGGPLIEHVNNIAYLIGIVSFGYGCATDYPGVYTKVSYFINWVEETLKIY